MFSIKKTEHSPFKCKCKYGGLNDTSAYSGDFTKNNAQNVFATLFYKTEREGEKECEFWVEGTETASGLALDW